MYDSWIFNTIMFEVGQKIFNDGWNVTPEIFQQFFPKIIPTLMILLNKQYINILT